MLPQVKSSQVAGCQVAGKLESVSSPTSSRLEVVGETDWGGGGAGLSIFMTKYMNNRHKTYCRIEPVVSGKCFQHDSTLFASPPSASGGVLGGVFKGATPARALPRVKSLYGTTIDIRGNRNDN